MALRPCLECGTPTNQTRCPTHTTTHRAQQNQGRPTSTTRGYGTQHQQARKQLATTLPTHCWYGCGTILTPNSNWVAAHITDGDPNSPRVVSCRTCNERAKQRR